MTAIHSPTSYNFYPINLDLRERKVLFLGGGRDTLHEAHKLLEFGALLDIVSEKPIREIQELSRTHSHKLRLIKKSVEHIGTDEFKISDYALVFAYSKFNDRNEQLVHLCRAKGVLYATRFGEGDFLVPRTLRRGHLKVSVSSDHISGALEEVLMNSIEAYSLQELDSYALFLDSLAEQIANLPTPITSDQKNKTCEFIKENSARSDIARALRRNNFSEAKQLFKTNLEDFLESSTASKTTE